MPGLRLYTRREFIGATATTAFAPSLAVKAFGDTRVKDVLVGAVRWDAWYKKTDASVFAQRSLSSEAYFGRAPFFCASDKQWNVSCTGSASEMADEIRAAARAGLKYWAFDWYTDDDSSLRVAWYLYRASPCRDLINWCGVIGLDAIGCVPFGSGKWRVAVAQWATYLREPGYQKVVINGVERPLLYLLWDENQLKWFFGNDVGNVKVCLQYLRMLLVEEGGEAPYVVLLDGLPGAEVTRAIGADAISNYISGFKGNGSGPFPYAELDKQTQKYWETLASSGCDMIPIAMVGWDNRPRQEKPVPWQPAKPTPNPIRYFIAPTSKEFASHIASAVDFINRSRIACPSKTLLIYSWNECDEGGGMMPTIANPDAPYLAAVASVIAR